MTTWADLGYHDDKGNYTVPCVKNAMNKIILSWTHDSFGRYTLHARRSLGSVDHVLPGSFALGECPPEDDVRDMEARLLAAAAILFRYLGPA